MNKKLVLLVSVWLQDNNIAGFEAFERNAALLMAKHGGKIEHVIRLDGTVEDGPFEVHVVTFSCAQAFADYRNDPATLALAKERTAVIQKTTIWFGEEKDYLPNV